MTFINVGFFLKLTTARHFTYKFNFTHTGESVVGTSEQTGKKSVNCDSVTQ